MLFSVPKSRVYLSIKEHTIQIHASELSLNLGGREGRKEEGSVNGGGGGGRRENGKIVVCVVFFLLKPFKRKYAKFRMCTASLVPTLHCM